MLFLHFKYVWAGGRDLILTSVAHLLKVVGVLEVRTLSGAGVSVPVCTRGAAFEIDWWWFWVFSVDTTILQRFLSTPACTDMVCSKELEHDVTTTAGLILAQNDDGPLKWANGPYPIQIHANFQILMAI